MSDFDLFTHFAAALVIGMLIGLEREHAAQPEVQLFAGVRTFALIGLAGCTAALVSTAAGTPLAFVAVLLVLGALLSIAYFVVAGRNDIGLTTEISAVITFLAGALCYWNYLMLAAAIAVITTLLLSLKGEIHRFAHTISRQDIYATLKFGVITAIILPVLPNQSFGPPPFDVLNPQRVWLMVVLVSGISFLGYVLIKLLPGRNGVGITGLLGGLVSSTAVTISSSERSKENPPMARALAFSVVVAWTVMFMRTPIEIGAVDPSLVGAVWLPMVAAALLALAYAGYIYLSLGRSSPSRMQFSNPFELRPALQFGLLYAVILVGARAAQLYFGQSGLYLSAIFGGAADVNAITLSVAELHRTGSLSAAVAVRAVVLAAIANTLVKAAIVVFVAVPAMRRVVLPAVPLTIAAAAIALWFV